MKVVVALSVDGERTRVPLAELAGKARRALQELTGTSDAVTRPFATGQLISSRLDDRDGDDLGGAAAVLLGRSCRTHAGELLDGVSLVERMRSSRDAALASIAPPFAACVALGPDQPFVGATDACGLQHLYHCSGDGWAAVSSSSLVLSVLNGGRLDQAAIGSFALVGNFLSCDTPYEGVRKLAAGHWCSLSEGRVEDHRYLEPVPEAPPFASAAEAIKAGERALTESVEACLAVHPSAFIELSGGLDSRAILAAVPAERRRNLHALTLGRVGSPDVLIAADIAGRTDIPHTVVDTAGLDRLSPAEALSLVDRASRQRDYTGNATELGVIDWVESHVPQEPRLTGGNGEFARGFYYPYLDPRSPPRVTDDLVASLARWRFLKGGADPALFVAGFLEDARAATVRALQEDLRGDHHDWLTATDELYLRQRMQRWLGIELSASAQSRAVLAPFFDPRYLAWSRRAHPSAKRGSRLFSGVLTALDAELGGIELDSGGLTPAQIARAGLVDRLQEGRSLAWRARRKLGGRFLSRQPGAAAGLAGLASTQWRHSPELLAPLEQVDFIDFAGVRELASGERAASASAVSLLVNLCGILGFQSTQ